MNWNLILSAGTQSVEGLHPTHLPQDFYNKNQQGVLKVEEVTSVEVDADKFENCATQEERNAFITEWDANYCEAVFLEINDRYSDDY